MKETRSPDTATAAYVAFDAEVLIRAAQEAVREALARHKVRGQSIVIWRDGKVVVVPSEEIEV